MTEEEQRAVNKVLNRILGPPEEIKIDLLFGYAKTKPITMADIKAVIKWD